MNTVIGIPYVTGRLKAEMVIASCRLRKLEAAGVAQEQIKLLRETVAALSATLEMAEAALAGQVTFERNSNGGIIEVWA